MKQILILSSLVLSILSSQSIEPIQHDSRKSISKSLRRLYNPYNVMVIEEKEDTKKDCLLFVSIYDDIVLLKKILPNREDKRVGEKSIGEFLSTDRTLEIRTIKSETFDGDVYNAMKEISEMIKGFRMKSVEVFFSFDEDLENIALEKFEAGNSHIQKYKNLFQNFLGRNYSVTYFSSSLRSHIAYCDDYNPSGNYFIEFKFEDEKKEVIAKANKYFFDYLKSQIRENIAKFDEERLHKIDLSGIDVTKKNEKMSEMEILFLEILIRSLKAAEQKEQFLKSNPKVFMNLLKVFLRSDEREHLFKTYMSQVVPDLSMSSFHFKQTSKGKENEHLKKIKVFIKQNMKDLDMGDDQLEKLDKDYETFTEVMIHLMEKISNSNSKIQSEASEILIPFFNHLLVPNRLIDIFPFNMRKNILGKIKKDIDQEVDKWVNFIKRFFNYLKDKNENDSEDTPEDESEEKSRFILLENICKEYATECFDSVDILPSYFIKYFKRYVLN